jgi:hypothetical protein
MGGTQNNNLMALLDSSIENGKTACMAQGGEACMTTRFHH